MVLDLQPAKGSAKVNPDKNALHLQSVKGVSQSQSRSRWFCTYFLFKESPRVMADQDSLSLTFCQTGQLELTQIKMVLHLPSVNRTS